MISVAIPDPLKSDREYERFNHMDLGDIETRDLVCELVGLRCQVWLLRQERYARVLGHFEQRRRIEWLRERIERVERELRERRYANQEIKGQPKPRLAQGVRL